jgi:hypothetical protein
MGMADDLELFADDGDGDFLRPDPEPEIPPPPAGAGGLVITLPMGDGTLLRVAAADEIRLTLVGGDGMVTVVLERAEVSMMQTALDLAKDDQRRRGVGL